MKRAARTSDHSSHPPMFAAPRGAAFLFSEPDACTFIRTDRRFRFCATNNDRCRWHRRGLCPPVRRDRSGARHGHARRLCRHARGGGLRRIPMLCQHDPSEPVGIWLELREDHRGLFAHGRLIPDVRRGRELLSLLRAGAIGWVVDRFSYSEGPHRSAHAHPSHLCGRPLGDLDRHVPDADGCTRAQREARASRKFAHRRPDSPSGNYRVPRNPKSSMTRFS
jgi:hypothetical protein